MVVERAGSAVVAVTAHRATSMVGVGPRARVAVPMPVPVPQRRLKVPTHLLGMSDAHSKYGPFEARYCNLSYFSYGSRAVTIAAH